LIHYKFIVLPNVRVDVREAKQWYEQKSPSLPKRFDKDLRATFKQLKLRPLSHAVRYKNVRIANLKVFPYAVHYIVKENTVLITAVFHSASNPENWIERTL
jgi:plasmid stabilization system protein ParE